MSQAELFLIAMLVIYAVPFALWRIGRTDRFAPLVVVQILCGIVLGPGLAGRVYPGVHARLFGAEVLAPLNGIASWGVMLFVWLAGIELDLGVAWRDRRAAFVTAGLALGTPLLLGAAAAGLMLQRGGWIGAGAQPWQFVLGVGMACAVTALPILVQFMDRLGILRTALGQRVLSYASLDDVAIWGVLAVILMDGRRIGGQVAFLVGLALAGWGIRALMVRLAERDRWQVGILWLILVGLVADRAGLHFMVGAFLAGVVLDAAWFGRARLDAARDLVLQLLMPVFFLSTGLKTQWSLGGASVLLAALLLLGASVGGKLLGIALAGRVLQWRAGEAALIGWLLQTKALIMIIFANVLLERGLITSDTFTALLLMAVASTALTMPMAQRAGRESGL
jgi:Kef-type K+ transport system membrane component KefB